MEAKCNEQNPVINWSTASETNSAYFSIYGSYDLSNYVFLKNINSEGSQSSGYNYTSPVLSFPYYKLMETSQDGNKVFVGNIANPCNTKVEVSILMNNKKLLINDLNKSQNYQLRIYDRSGRMIINKTISQSQSRFESSISKCTL